MNTYKQKVTQERNEALLAKCRELLGAGKRVDAVKAYRAATGASLQVAMNALGIK